MKTALLACVMALSLGACATRPASEGSIAQVPADRIYGYQTAQQGAASIIVTRDTGYTGSLCLAAVLINGQKAADLRTSERVHLYLSAGEHIIGVQASGGGLCTAGDERRTRRETTVSFDVGQVRKYRISVGADGMLTLAPTTI